MNQVIVDGHDLGVYGFVVGQFPGRFAPPATEWDTHDDPTVPGEKVSTIRRGSRAFSLVGWINGPTPSEAQANIERIAWVLHSRQPHTVQFPDRSGASITAYARLIRPEARRAESVLGLYEQVTIEFVAADAPFFAADSLTTISNIQDTPVALTAGSTDLIDVVIAIQGPATDPEITIRDYLGNVQASIAFTLELDGASDFLVLDLKRKTAYQNQTGNPNEGDSRIGIDFWPGETGNEWFVLRAAWWDFIGETWATAECSSGTAEFRYRIASEV